MPADSPANNGTLFRLALLGMLLSLWLIGRASLRQEIVEEPHNVAVVERPEQGDPVTVVVPPVEVDADTPGGVVGIVKFVGKWPAPRPIAVSLDPYCAQLYQGQEELLFERWVMGEHETVQNTLIHVTAGLADKSWPVPLESAVIELQECRFKPHITVVQREQVVEIRSLDHQTHHSPDLISAINRGIPHSPAQLPTGITLWMPEHSELGIYLKCNVHSWMNGYIHVLDHPYFDVTGPQGTYEINNLPPGEYELSLWHEVKEFRESVKPVKVIIEAGKITKIDFTIEQRSRVSE